jgi:hypothetical protein
VACSAPLLGSGCPIHLVFKISNVNLVDAVKRRIEEKLVRERVADQWHVDDAIVGTGRDLDVLGGIDKIPPKAP